MGKRLLGYAPVFKTDDGEFAFDRTKIRRDGVSGDDIDGDDIDGDDIDGDDIDGDDVDGDDIGKLSKAEKAEIKKRRKGARGGGKDARKAVRDFAKSQRRDDDDSVPSNHKPKAHKMNQATILAKSGSNAGAATADVELVLRPQDNFEAENLRAFGTAGTLVKSVRFANEIVFDESDGVPIEMFAATATQLGLIAGRKLRGGLDIKVSCSVPAAGNVSVAIPGWYESSRC